MAFVWVLLLAVTASVAQAGQNPPPLTSAQAPARDVVRDTPASATVHGKVTAAATGEPLQRVRVTLNGTVTNPPSAVTDTRGEYELGPIPPGTYTITATRAGFLPAQYGQRRPREAGRVVQVDKDQAREGVDIALSRGAVLAGRLTDELGEPAFGSYVEAVELRYIRGRRVAVAARTTWTNDLGEYRLANLEPGAYQVRASSRETWESDDGRTTYAYAITYFPSVTAGERPQAVTVAGGQQMLGLDFHLVPGRTARVTGAVFDRNGAPMAGQLVHLSSITRTVGGALFSSGPGPSAMTDPSGAFECRDLAPGEYLVIAGGPNDRIAETVVVQTGDARHVVLTVQKPAEAAGSIVTDEEAPPPFPASRISVVPIATGTENVLPGWGEASDAAPRPDWTFRIPNTNGEYLFRVTGLPDQWMLSRVTLGGRDVTDTPIAIRRGGQDANGLQIVLSRKSVRLDGTVLNKAGNAAPDTTVVVFADDRRLWGVGSRFTRAVRPDKSGRFSVGSLPPAVYRAIALEAVIDGQWEDPQFLESLTKLATRVEVTEQASTDLKLTIQEPER